MTPEKQRIAIAEACPTIFTVLNGWVRYRFDHQKAGVFVDLSSDLNAMHEVEKTLDNFDENGGPDQGLYCEMLARVVLAKWDSNNTYDQWCIAHATANQRLEAFLRTIGKWEDE